MAGRATVVADEIRPGFWIAVDDAVALRESRFLASRQRQGDEEKNGQAGPLDEAPDAAPPSSRFRD